MKYDDLHNPARQQRSDMIGSHHGSRIHSEIPRPLIQTFLHLHANFRSKDPPPRLPHLLQIQIPDYKHPHER
jgi:hypothetical protein